MDVVGEITIGIIVLRRQAVCIYGGMDGPRMNFREWKVLIDDGDAVSIFLQQLRKQGLVHARAVGTFEIVVVYGYDLGIFVSARGAPGEVDFLHELGVGILCEIDFGHAHERFAIFGEQEIVSLLLIAPLKRDGQRVVIWKLAGLERTQVDLYSCWGAVERTHLPRNTLANRCSHGLAGA